MHLGLLSASLTNGQASISVCEHGLGRAHQASRGSGCLNHQQSVGPVKHSLVMGSSPDELSQRVPAKGSSDHEGGQGNFGFETPSNKPFYKSEQPHRETRSGEKMKSSGEEHW